jgi:hypothetical protein
MKSTVAFTRFLEYCNFLQGEIPVGTLIVYVTR